MKKFWKIIWWTCNINALFAVALILNRLGVLTTIMLIVSVLSLLGWVVFGMLQYGMDIERKRNGSKNTYNN